MGSQPHVTICKEVYDVRVYSEELESIMEKYVDGEYCKSISPGHFIEYMEDHLDGLDDNEKEEWEKIKLALKSMNKNEIVYIEWW